MEFISVSLFASRRINRLVQNKNYLSLAQGWLKCTGASRSLSTPALALRNYSCWSNICLPIFPPLTKILFIFQDKLNFLTPHSVKALSTRAGKNILLLWSIRTNCCSRSSRVNNIKISILKRVLWLKSYLCHAVVVSYLPWPWVPSHWE